jgi:hypothetical protein
MKEKLLQEKLYKILESEDFLLQYIFNEIERSKFYEHCFTNEFYEALKIKVVGKIKNGYQLLDVPARQSFIKEAINNFSSEYDILLLDYQKSFDIYPFKLLKLNIIAALEEELSKPDAIKLTNTLPKIKIKAEKVLLYAAFKEIANELFINPSDHRLSQLISDNFIGEDGSPIDQKTCYNQLNSGLSNNTKENLQKILQIISKRLI